MSNINPLYTNDFKLFVIFLHTSFTDESCVERPTVERPLVASQQVMSNGRGRGGGEDYLLSAISYLSSDDSYTGLVPRVRSAFPETWIFDEVEIG